MIHTILIVAAIISNQVLQTTNSLAHSDWQVISVQRNGLPADDFQITQARPGEDPVVNELQTMSFARRKIVFYVGSDKSRTGHQLNFDADWIPDRQSGKFRVQILGEWHAAEYRIVGNDLKLSLFIDGKRKPLEIHAKRAG